MSSSFFGEDFVGVKGVCRQKNFEGEVAGSQWSCDGRDGARGAGSAWRGR